MLKFTLLTALILFFNIFSSEVFAVPPLKLSGLQSETRVSHDQAGISHIYAHNDHDAYFMMGYIEARDRFFQMDCARHYYEGKLSELLGDKSLESDRQIRKSGLPFYAAQSFHALLPKTRLLLQAYSDGVNSYLKNNPLPTFYKILNITKKSVPKWEILDSLTITRGIAANVTAIAITPGNKSKQVVSFDSISQSESFLKYVTAGKKGNFNGKALWYADIYRSAPNEPATTIPDFFNHKISTEKNISTTQLQNNLIAVHQESNLDKVDDNGSNIFVLDGKHTATGYPILANDSHLPLRSPSLWYLIDISIDDPNNLMDAHLSIFMPGGFIYKSGHNQQIAWGSTTSHVDVSDVYLENLTLNKDNVPTQTLFLGKSVPLKQIKQTYYYNTFDGDTLKVADRNPIKDDTFLISYRNNGPLFSSLGNKGYGIQSTILGNINARDIEGFFALPRAKNLTDFKDAIHHLDISYYNFGYVDNKGNIAFFESGEIPLRKDLEAGKLVDVPPYFVRNSIYGYKNSWIPLKHIPSTQSLPYKIIPFDEMPHIINPKQGFFVNSNNDPVGLTLNNNPINNRLRSNKGIYYLGFKPAPGERAQKITRLLDRKLSQNKKISLSDVKSIQTNDQSILAEHFVPFILNAFKQAQSENAPVILKNYSKDHDILEAINKLRQWNFSTPTGIKEVYNPGKSPNDLHEQNHADINYSISTTIFYVWQGRFLVNTIEHTLLKNSLPVESYPIYTATALHLLDTFNSTHGIGASGLNFFDSGTVLDPYVARDYLILKSLREALDLLKSHSFSAAFAFSSNQNDYRWGKLHRVIFNNPLGRNIPPLGGFNNYTPKLPGIPRDGGIETINAASFNGLARNPSDFIFTSGASLRDILEMSPTAITSFISLPGGENEEPTNPYFANMLGDWLTGNYFTETTDNSSPKTEQLQQFVPSNIK